MSNETLAIIETVTRLVTAIDKRNFSLAQEQFSNEVTIDYTSLFGGIEESISSETLINRWSSFLPKLKLTQHTLSNFLVDVQGNTASSHCYIQGFHFLPYTTGGSKWLVTGNYVHRLEKKDGAWKITYMKLQAVYEEGNRGLLAHAANAPIQKKVQFTSGNNKLSGILFLPADFKDSDQLPAVIVTGSWTTVKEQMPATYASQIAKQGMAAFIFDFSGWGESEGTPRQHESASKKVADLKNAISFLQARPEINPEKIGGLAICASAGYMAITAAEDERLKAWVGIAPWLHNKEIVYAIYGGEEGIKEKISLAQTALHEWQSEKKETIVPACSTTDERAPMFGQWDYYLNPQRGAIPEWKNAFNILSWKDWLELDPISFAAKIKSPTFLIHSEDAAIPQGTKQFYEGLPNAHKKISWMKGNQFDFYDNEGTVMEASTLSFQWLKEQLH